MTYSPLLPLALLLFTGLYLFVLPYATTWRNGRRDTDVNGKLPGSSTSGSAMGGGGGDSRPEGERRPKPRGHRARRRARASHAAATQAKSRHGAEGLRRERPPVNLLSGGNPQIAKADGDAPVQAYIAAMPGWKRDLGKRLDALIVRNVPNVRKAVKWNSPFYGIEGQGWFLAFHVFTRYVKVAFFRGTSLRPVPPGASKGKDTRYIDIHEGDELDEAQMATWVKQAAALPGVWSTT